MLALEGVNQGIDCEKMKVEEKLNDTDNTLVETQRTLAFIKEQYDELIK